MSLSGKIVIAVEDAEDAQMILNLVLDTLNAQYWDIVGSVDRAIEKLTGITYDLLILDLGLPDKPGIELVRYLYENRIRIPVLILTGTLPIPTTDFLRYSNSDFLTIYSLEKTLDMSKISITIRQLIFEHTAKIKIPELLAEIESYKIELDNCEKRISELIYQRDHKHDTFIYFIGRLFGSSWKFLTSNKEIVASATAILAALTYYIISFLTVK